MREPTKLDKTFHIIIKRMVEAGKAPHYTEVAAELGISLDEERNVLHELFSKDFLIGFISIPSRQNLCQPRHILLLAI